MRLEGRVALVTGGGRGIGLATAKRLVTEGAAVAIADLDRGQAEAAAAAMAREYGATSMGLAMDVTDESSVEAGVAAVAAAFGGVDILVNNAGIQHIAALDQLAFSDWKRVLAVHLDGAFLATRACLRLMYAAKHGGCILFLGSVHSKTASVLKAPYTAAKHGVLGLCRAVAKEGAPHGVRSNVICPGFVRTQLVAKQIPEQAVLRNMTEDEVVATMLKDTLDGQFTAADEVAETAVFLAAQKSLALTGQSIMVSHGWLME